MIPQFCSCAGDVGEDGAGGRVADGGGGVYLCAYCQLSRAVTSITLLHRSSLAGHCFVHVSPSGAATLRGR